MAVKYLLVRDWGKGKIRLILSFACMYKVKMGIKMKRDFLCLLILSIFCLGFFLTWGCAPKGKFIPFPKKAEVVDIKQKAQEAWHKKECEDVEKLYTQLLKTGEINKKERIIAWKRIAHCAALNKDFQTAYQALHKWSILDPEAVNIWDWHRVKVLIFEMQEQTEVMKQYLVKLTQKETAPLSLRFQAGLFLSDFYFKQKDFKQWLQTIRGVYEQFRERDLKAKLEDYLLQKVKGFDKPTWEQVWRIFPPEDKYVYPYCLIEWEHVLYLFQEEKITWFEAWDRLTRVLSQADLLAEERLQSKLNSLEQSYGLPKIGVALLIPLDSDYQEFAWKILKGADVALWQMYSKDLPISFTVINSNALGWEEKLAQLPAHYKVIGGPLRKEVWENILAHDLQKERVFFNFRSSLEPGEEGKDGYRFFPSSIDQVRPLIKMLTNDFDINKFAILYPKSHYGQRMAQTFRQEVHESNATIGNMKSYAANMQTGWKDLVADFLQLPGNWQKQNSNSATFMQKTEPDFQAVFLPDAFSKAQILIPEFFFFDSGDLVFLGPSLWSQEIRRVSKLDQQYYKLTLMTGTWWSENPNEAVKGLKKGLRQTVQGGADFWTALGYDFLRFVFYIKDKFPHLEKKRINNYLSKISDFTWSIAPIQWNEQGKAKQDLFVFQPVKDKLKRVDVKEFKYRWQRIKKE